jgi:hypothetical protein
MDYKWEDLSQKAKDQLHCYLYPNKPECLEVFAKDLGMSIEDLKEIGELCSKPDSVKETFEYEIKEKINEQTKS